MTTTEMKEIDPQHKATIDSIIAQESPGKDEKSAGELTSSIQNLSNEALLELVRQAYKEDAAANTVVIDKASALLKERGAEKETKAVIEEVRSQNWRDLLGEFLGGKLHELISDQTNAEALLGHGKKALEGAAGSTGGLVDQLGLDADGSKAVSALAEALAKDAVKEADKFLESDKGKALLTKISQWVDNNPGYVLALAILAAAGAVAADMKIPELKQTFKIAEGLSASVSAKLGSLRNISLQAARLDMQYVRGQFSAKAAVEQKQGEGVSGEASARYGDKDTFIEGMGSIDPEGKLTVGLSGALKDGLFSAEGGAKHNLGTGQTNANFNVRYGDKERNVSGGLLYNSDGTFTGNLGAEFSQGNLSAKGAAAYDLGAGQLSSGSLEGKYNLGGGTSLFGSGSYKPGEHKYTLGTSYESGPLSGKSYLENGTAGLFGGTSLNYNQGGNSFGLEARDQGANGSIDQASLSLGLRPDEMVAITLKYGLELSGKQTAEGQVKIGDDKHNGTVGASYDGKDTRATGSYHYEKDNWLAELGGTYNLTAGNLEAFSAKLGFKDPNQFRSFSLELAHSYKDGVSRQEARGMFESQLGAFQIRGNAQFAMQDGKASSVGGGVLGAYTLDDKWKVLGGAQATHNFQTGNTSYMPQLGVQYRQIPVTVGYDTETKGFRIGLTIPF